MPRLIITAAVILVVGGIAQVALSGTTRSGSAFDDDPVDAKAELRQEQSPILPAPKGLKFIDQADSDKRLVGFRTPEGFKLEIVAEPPAVVNPVDMAFAGDGTPIVVEWSPVRREDWRESTETVKYKDGSARTFRRMGKKTKDVVKVLSSSKGDGVFDTAKVVLKDEVPAGILLHQGWLYLSGRGTLRRYRQSTPGGAYDVREIIAQGFAGTLDGQVSGMTLGNDGWLYVTAGAGDHYVEGSDGSRATVLRTGAIFRCRPDGNKLHTFAIGFCNPRGNGAFDLGGNLFQIDNDVAGAGKFTGCRLIHVADQADYGWRLAPGSQTRPDPVRGAVFGELPGRMPALLKTGRGEAAGLFIYNDTRLPEDYRGLLFYPDASRRVIRAYKAEPAGASFKAVEEFEFLSAAKDESFRPCKMVLGPDGAIYVVQQGGRYVGETGRGRIYRLTWTGTKENPALPPRALDSWSKIAKLDDEDLIKALSSEEASDRERARQELVKRGDKNRPALIKVLNNRDTVLVAKIAALGALQSMFDASVQTAFVSALKDGDVELQRLAAEALGLCAKKADSDACAALLRALTTEDLSVRRAVALAMGQLGGPGTGDNLAAALSFDQSKDVFLRDGIVRGLELLGKPGIDALIALADSGVQKDTNRVVEAILGMRDRAAFHALPTLLKHMHVSSSQRADLIRSAGNYLLDPPVSLDAVVASVSDGPKETEDVKKALLEVLGTPGTLKGAKCLAQVVALLDDPAAEIRQQAMSVATGLLTNKDAAAQRTAVIAVGATPRGARLAGTLYLEKKLPRTLRDEVSQGLRKHEAKDGEAAKLLKEVTKKD